tara:strand:+ start:2569 stop:2934 length:366 start_codon:yes stop_codon:yes gene_type:complete
MDHMNLNDELRKQLLESAAWGKVGIDMGDWEYVGDQDVEQLQEGTRQQVAEEEEAEVHVCPLCTSQLSEAIDEDSLVEHLDVVMGLVDRLSQLNEGEEDVEAVIDETLYNLLVGDNEEEAE